MSVQPNNRGFRRPLLVLLVFSLLASALVVGRAMGRWLVHEDSLSSADAIVVLGGSMPYRAEEAAKVFSRGEAPEVWVSRPASPATELLRMGIHVVGEEEYSREVLISNGVPELSIHILPDPILNTDKKWRKSAAR